MRSPVAVTGSKVSEPHLPVWGLSRTSPVTLPSAETKAAVKGSAPLKPLRSPGTRVQVRELIGDPLSFVYSIVRSLTSGPPPPALLFHSRSRLTRVLSKPTAR